jgi:hypothetical protein
MLELLNEFVDYLGLKLGSKKELLEAGLQLLIFIEVILFSCTKISVFGKVLD